MATFNMGFDAKSALASSLALISDENKASFFAEGNIGEVNPGLRVEGLGNIGMPISTHDVERIISRSRQAPFGKGSDTIVDTSVRKTWEIDGSQIQLTHPKWHQIKREIVNDAAQQLGIAKGAEIVGAELYKLLVYEPGAMFKAHTDTEKADRMFGTLAICIPCKHEGGDVLVSFNGKKSVLSTAPTSEWSTSYLAWYADVIHEVRPVVSGYRIILTFNLVQNGLAVRKSLADHDGLCASLKSTMMQWSEHGSRSYLISLLEHKYTDASLSLNGLKGVDHSRGNHVAMLAQQCNFICYLASVEKVVSGGAEEDYGPWRGFHEIFDAEDKLHLKRVVDLDGNVVLENVPIEEEDFVQSEPFNRRPDEEDYEGYTGNEGAYATHWYRNTAMILVPQKHQIDLSMNIYKPQKRCFDGGFNRNHENSELRDFIMARTSDYERDPTNQQNRWNLERICERVVIENTAEREKSKTRIKQYDWIAYALPYSDDTVAIVSGIFLLLGRIDLAEKALQAVERHIAGLSATTLAIHFPKFAFEDLRHYLDALVAALSNPEDTLDVCKSVVGAFASQSSEEKEKALNWTRCREDDLLSTKRNLTRDDAASVVEMACNRDSETWLLDRVVPFVLQHRENGAFTFAFIDQLLIAAKKGALPEDSRNAAVKAVCLDIVDALRLPQLRSDFGPPDSQFGRMKESRNSQYLPPKAEDIATVHRICIELNMEEECKVLVQRTLDATEKLRSDCFQSILFPYLRNLVRLLKDRAIDLGNYRTLFMGCLYHYVSRSVEAEPVEPTDWKQKKRGCKNSLCSDCRQLDAFLLSPSETTTQFKAPQNRRTHIERQLPSPLSAFDLSTETQRNGAPHTLVITKQHSHYEKSHRDWKHRARDTKRAISELAGANELEAILGDAYEDIMNLKPVVPPPSATSGDDSSSQLTKQRHPLGSVFNPPGDQIEAPRDTGAGGKRKVEVFDDQDARNSKRSKMREVVDLSDSP